MTKKEKTFLDQTAQRLHLTVDGESSILFGSAGGYQTMLWRNDQGLAVMTLSLHKLGQEPDQSAIRQFVKGTRLVMGFSVRRSRVELTLNVRFGNPNQVEKLAEAVAAVVEFLHASGYDNCCQNCGSAVETDPCIMTGVPSLLCDSCYQQLGHLQEQNQQAELGKTENVVAGTVGALLGSLLGVACIVLLGQLGYVAAVSGIVMAICTMKGYELLGGRFSTVGLVVSIVLMLGMTYVGYQLDWSVAVYNELKDYYELSLLDCFRMIPEMLRQEIIDSSTYIGELVKLYAFTLLGAIPTAISSMKPEAEEGHLPSALPAHQRRPRAVINRKTEAAGIACGLLFICFALLRLIEQLHQIGGDILRPAAHGHAAHIALLLDAHQRLIHGDAVHLAGDNSALPNQTGELHRSLLHLHVG